MMTVTARPTRREAEPERPTLRPAHWHRPLLVLAAAMTLLALATGVLALLDDRQITGVDAWLKPLKFSISTAVYSLTLSWMIGQLSRMRRLADVAGVIVTVGILIEMAIIVGFAAVGETSHFNVSTPLHAATWSVMAASIVTVWVMTLIVAVALLRNRLGDRARTLAIRSGAILAVIGMGLAFLMTGPTAQQLDDFQGIAGAHTVGVADGGPGLPLLGWSTVAGDLRIPHFVGMHALQVLPILVILLELLGRRVAALRSEGVRHELVVVGVAAFAATLAVLTAQALMGQSIVHPSGAILVAGCVVAVGSVAGVVIVVARGRRRRAA